MLVRRRAIAGFPRVKVRVRRTIGEDGMVRVVREMGLFVDVAGMEAVVMMLREGGVEAIAVV